jgi:hypothetical protein
MTRSRGLSSPVQKNFVVVVVRRRLQPLHPKAEPIEVAPR